MAEGAIVALDVKIQKLINNYTDLKNKYANLVVQKSSLEQNLRELHATTVASDQFSRLEAEHKQQAEELAQLRQENVRLQETVATYESKMQEATAKIDGIFDQLSEL